MQRNTVYRRDTSLNPEARRNGMESAQIVASSGAGSRFSAGAAPHESGDNARRSTKLPPGVSYRRRAVQKTSITTTSITKGIVMKSSLFLILLAAAGLASSASAGPIYKCAGPTGATVFSQTPCGKDAAAVASSSSKASTSANDAGNDKAALAEIDSRCDAGSHKIVDGYRGQFADANASIADLHRNLMVAGAGGVEKDPAVQKKIDALEAHKTDMLGSQDRELSTLRDQCQVERTAVLKRQADRDASRSMVKR
jgi:hypothetical protein